MHDRWRNPYSVIFANQIQDTEGKPPAALTSYECVLRFYLYWKTYRRKEFPTVRACLEQAVVTDPSYAEAFAVLSLVHSDAYRFRSAKALVPATRGRPLYSSRNGRSSSRRTRRGPITPSRWPCGS